MKDPLNDVKHFHQVCDLPVLTVSTFPSADRVKLRQNLIDEEIFELNCAINEHDLLGVAKEIADSIYVLVGMALEFGIPLDKVWDEVHKANMTKIDPMTGKVNKRDDGKVLKPLSYKPPDIAKALWS